MSWTSREEELLAWGATQGHILTSGGALESRYLPGRDFTDEDLPHHLKSTGKSHDTFKAWVKAGRLSHVVVGAWNRPLFTGGWAESGTQDTHVVNVQTPSLFVDLRFPLLRPTFAASVAGFSDLSMRELRLLSRQHTFAGYTLVDGEPPVAVRHHAIDWNYHPSFPRSRPNKWRIEASADGSSFKEWGAAVDAHGQSLYMERWSRMPGGAGPHLAMRRRATPGVPDAILCVVGNVFAYARDRPGALPEFPGAAGGGCANLADAAWRADNRRALEELLDLEGSTGRVAPSTTSRAWEITHSTLPWRQGALLFSGPVAVRGAVVEVGGQVWEVVDTSLSPGGVQELLQGGPAARL